MVVFLTKTVLGGEAETNIPLRVALDLSDGSHIIGIPAVSSIPIQTSYAKLDVPLKQIKHVKVEDDHKNALLELCNGDKLQGILHIEKLKVETIFGKVTVGIENISSIHVSEKTGVGLPIQLQDGLMLCYSFDKDETSKMTDKSGNGNHGEMQGATWTPKGKVGGACVFNGDGYIDAGNSHSLDIKSAITMVAWVLPQQSTGDHPIIAKEGDEGRQTYWFGVYNCRFGLLLGNGRGWGLDARCNGDVSPDQWQHLAATWDGSIWRCYQNGVLVGNGRYSATIPNSRSPVQIGQNSEARNTHFEGIIDEIMIFDRALSEKEIQQIYDLQK